MVGDVNLQIERADLYAKELDLLISTSYGPGRYDPHYEEGGQDYPLPYVRWTENRNMQAYLDLLAARAVQLARCAPEPFPSTVPARAYRAAASDAGMIAVLAYAERPERGSRRVEVAAGRAVSGEPSAWPS